MNIRNGQSLLVIFGVAFLWKFHIGSAIVCYDCNSAYDPRCGENFDPYTLGSVNCSLRDPPEGLEDVESTLCRTIKIEAFGKTRVVRGCGYIQDEARDDKSCHRSSGTHELFTTYCSCTSDLCNGGPARIQADLMAAVLIIAAVLRLYSS